MGWGGGEHLFFSKKPFLVGYCRRQRLSQIALLHWLIKIFCIGPDVTFFSLHGLNIHHLTNLYKSNGGDVKVSLDVHWLHIYDKALFV